MPPNFPNLYASHRLRPVQSSFTAQAVCQFTAPFSQTRPTASVGAEAKDVETGARRYGSLYFVRIKVSVLRLNVDEDRFNIIPPKGMGRGHETERRCDHFARYPQNLQGGKQGQGSVCKKKYIGNPQEFGEFSFKPIVEFSISRQPFAGPYFL